MRGNRKRLCKRLCKRKVIAKRHTVCTATGDWAAGGGSWRVLEAGSHGRMPGLEWTEDLSRRPKAGTEDLSDGRRSGPAGTGDSSLTSSAA